MSLRHIQSANFQIHVDDPVLQADANTMLTVGPGPGPIVNIPNCFIIAGRTRACST